MNDVTPMMHSPEEASAAEGRFERINPDYALRPGSYWRSKVALELEGPPDYHHAASRWVSYSVAAGTTLLVLDIRGDGDADHTVCLALHPDQGANESHARMLVPDFLAAFEAIDGVAVREREIEAIQAQIQAIQADIQHASSSPEYLSRVTLRALADTRVDHDSATGLPARPEDVNLDVLNASAPSLSQALDAIQDGSVHHVIDVVRSTTHIAEAQGRWFAGRSADLAAATQRLMPFFSEKARVALARVNGAVSKAHALLESVSTLTLFTGKDVHVTVIDDGETASPDTPITLYQARQFADENMAYLTRYVDAMVDSGLEDEFCNVLRKDTRLLDLLIPAARGVVLLSWSRQRVQIDDPFLAASRADELKQTALLIRDGRRILYVVSPIDDHKRASRLFPEVDLDGKVFTGVSGADITPADLRYTDRLSDLHIEAVRYRRFAVCLAGLIARGEVFPGIDYRDLFSGDGNDRALRYVRDDSGEGVLLEDVESVDAYLSRINNELRPGARVLVAWDAVLTPETAPGCFCDSSDRPVRRAWPREDASVVTVERDGDRLYVRMPDRYSEQMRRVTLWHAGSLVAPLNSFLCADNLDPEELDRLMAVRRFRSEYPRYLDLFARGREVARALRDEEEPTRERLRAALLDADIASVAQADKIAAETTRRFRAAGRLPAQGDDITALLNHAFELSDRSRIDIAALAANAADADITPLRVVIDAGNRVYLYAMPKQLDDRGAPQREVDRYRIHLPGMRFEKNACAAMYVHEPTESVVHEWPAARERALSKPPELALGRKAKLIDDLESNFERRRQLFCGPMSDAIADEVAVWLEHHYWKHRKTSSVVEPPAMFLPIGLACADGVGYVLCLNGAGNPLQAAARNASDASYERLITLASRQYAHGRAVPLFAKLDALRNTRGKLRQFRDFGLVACRASDISVGQDHWIVSAMPSMSIRVPEMGAFGHLQYVMANPGNVHQAFAPQTLQVWDESSDLRSRRRHDISVMGAIGTRKDEIVSSWLISPIAAVGLEHRDRVLFGAAHLEVEPSLSWMSQQE